MATLSAMNNEPAPSATFEKVDMKFEVVVIPVSDVDRSKAFYTKLGWRLDADFPFDNGFRVVQFTSPGSGCSIQFGTKMTTAAPGSAQGLYLIVSNVEAARKELVARGVEVSEVFHTSKPGAQFRPESGGRVSSNVVRTSGAEDSTVSVPRSRSATDRPSPAWSIVKLLTGTGAFSSDSSPRGSPNLFQYASA